MCLSVSRLDIAVRYTTRSLFTKGKTIEPNKNSAKSFFSHFISLWNTKVDRTKQAKIKRVFECLSVNLIQFI